jgi:cytochrome c oxidase subunit 2
MRIVPTVVVVTLGLVALAPAATAALGMPEPLTPRGEVISNLYSAITLIGIVMFLIVFVWLAILIIRFRESTGHGRATHEAERHSLKAELVWFVIPLIIVMSVGYAAYGGLVQLDRGITPADTKMEVHVVASQWNWMFDYGNGVKVTSDPNPMNGSVDDGKAFLVPANVPILYNITATDVIHAFQLMDAHRSTVIFLDANPDGPNRFNLQPASLPAGDYWVQCNKMCLNPGHAYMHAKVKAVPQAEFDHWMNGKQAEVGAKLVQHLALESASDGLHFAANHTALSGSTATVVGVRVIVDLQRTDAAVTLTATGAAPKHFAAGASDDTFYAFDLLAEGNYTLSGSNGGSLTFHVFKAEEKSISLVDFRLQPDNLALQAGKTYLIKVSNIGTTTHDLTVGHYNGGATNITAHSPSISASGAAQFIVMPLAAGSYDMWCNQPGHYGLGMHGTVTVS